MSDLISRQAAIEAIVNTVSKIGLHDNSEVAGYGATFRQHEIIDIIEGMPSAQPERKPGRWKEHIFEGIMGGRPRALMCNQCNSLSLHATNFCPNCGADMRGEKDE